MRALLAFTLGLILALALAASTGATIFSFPEDPWPGLQLGL